jgi:L-ascorbate metabolism protein UlaG (beta-lactamase superfamily)
VLVLAAILGLAVPAVGVLASGGVSLEFLGNTCILITAPDGTRIVCDPYRIFYGFPSGLSPLPGDLTADAVTVSHAHVDHNNTAAFPGASIFDAPGEYRIGAATITGYSGFQGEEGVPSTTASPNTIFVIDVAGVKIVHFGDSAVVTDPAIVAAVSNADVALLNIDPYVIPWDEAMPFMDSIAARTIIPSHYSHGRANQSSGPMIYVGVFLNRLDGEIVVSDSSTGISVHPGMPRQVVVLKPLFLN